MKRWLLVLLIGWIACGVTSPRADAKPYLPADDDEVLETLPRALLVGRNELAELRRELAAKPRDLELAAKVATRYVELGKQESSPRFYGYARAALRPWWDEEIPPTEVLRLRAKLNERDHDYDRAIDDLKLLLAAAPEDHQGWIELANIYRVQGKYAESLRACDSLSEVAGRAQSIFCRVPLQVATGEATEAYQALAELLPVARQEFPTAVQWVLTMQAEAAVALGRHEAAEQHFLAGLENNPQDKYLLRAYADFLLDQDRAPAALELLREQTTDTGILLRAAIAAKRTGQSDLAADWQAQLERRFEEIRLRGGEPHGRFEARCALQLQENPQSALTLALANWEKQKETRDTRNVLEAALACDDAAAAQPVLEFLARHGTEHATLTELAKQLGSTP